MWSWLERGAFSVAFSPLSRAIRRRTVVNEAARLVTVDAGVKTADLLDHLAGSAAVLP